MADNIINIILRVRDETKAALDDVAQQLRELQKAAQPSTETVASGLADDLTKSGEEAQKASTKVAEYSESLHYVTAATKQLTIAIGAFLTAGFVRNIAETAGRADVLATVLNVVGTNAGINTQKLKEMDKAVQQMGITAAASRQSLTQLIQSGLVSTETAYKAAQLARAAQDLAVISGQNSSDTFSRLVVNINQMDSLGLRFMGIMLNREEAYKRYADAIGKSAEQLTLAEKKQAFFNGVLEESIKLSGTYEASMTKASKQLQSFARYHETLYEALGESLQPAYLAFIETLTEVTKELTHAAEAFNANGVAANALGEIVRGLGKTFTDVAKVVAAFPTFSAFAGVAVLLTPIVLLFSKFFSILKAGALLGEPVVAILYRITAASGVAAESMTALGLAGVRAAFLIRTAFISLFALFAGYSFGNVLREMFPAIDETVYAFTESILAEFERMKLGIERASLQIKSYIYGAFGINRADIKTRLAEIEKEFADLRKRVTSATALIGTASRNDTVAQAKEAILEAEKLNRQIAKIQAERAQFEPAAKKRDPYAEEQISKLTDQLDKLNKQKDAINKKIGAFVRDTDVAGQKAIEEFRVNLRVDPANIRNEFQEAKDEIDGAKKALKLTDEDIKITAGFVLSKGFASAVEGFTTLMKAVGDTREWKIDGNVRRLATSLQTAELSLRNLLKDAKTFDELSVAIRKAEEYALGLSDAMARETFNAAVRRDKAAVEELKASFSGLSARLEEVRSAQDVVRTAMSDSATAALQFNQVILELGGNVADINDFNPSAISRSLEQRRDNTLELSRLAIEQARQLAASEKAIYDQRIADATELYRRQVESINKERISEQDKAEKIKALDKEFTLDRIKITKEYYDKAVQQRDGALAKYKQYAEQVKRLDKEIADAKRERDRDVFDLEQKGRSEEDKLFFDRQRAQELLSQGTALAAKRDFETAKQVLTESISLFKSMADRAVDSQGRVSRLAITEVEDARNALISVTEQENKLAKKARDEQLATFKAFADGASKLADQLKELGGEIILKVKFEIEDFGKKIDEAKKKIAEKIRDGVMMPIEIPDKPLDSATTKVKALTDSLREANAQDVEILVKQGQLVDALATLDEANKKLDALKAKRDDKAIPIPLADLEKLPAQITSAEAAVNRASVAVKTLQGEIAKLSNVRVAVDLSDAKKAEEAIAKLRQQAQGDITINANIDELELLSAKLFAAVKRKEELDAALKATPVGDTDSIKALNAQIKLLSDSVLGYRQRYKSLLDDIQKGIAQLPTATIKADATQATEAVGDLRAEADTPVVIPVTADTTQAKKAIEEVNNLPLAKKDVNLNVENINGFKLGKGSYGDKKLFGLDTINVDVQVSEESRQKFFDSFTEGEDSLKKRPLDINFEWSRTGIKNIREQIADGLKDIPITFKASVEQVGFALGGLVRLATGGPPSTGYKVNGPGTKTSDSILAMLSNGEWVLRAAAVDYYGDSFLSALNAMAVPKNRLPAYAAGGPVQSIASKVTSPSEPEQSLNLSFNSKSIGRVRGSRDTIKGLVSALKDLERGIG